MNSTQPKLKIVPQESAPPYDEARGLKRIETLRLQLLRAAARHATEGKSGSFPERIHKASDLSGIPRTQIEAEARK